MTTALLVEDDPSSMKSLNHWVQQQNVGTKLASSLRDARSILETDWVDLAIVDVHLPDGNGTELDVPRGTSLVFVSGDTSFEQTRSALRSGAVDYLAKPLDLDRLEEIITARTKSLVEAPSMVDDVPMLGPFVGRSTSMRTAYEQLCRLAGQSDTVFIHGDTGTGKELAARLLHDQGPRAGGPFEIVNCGAFSQNLIESELFGHERGSFTGADRRHIGVFERACGGSLFLDEVTEMPLELQVKLLRALESKTITRVGGREQIPVDVRVITASNRDPSCVVAEGIMREDLFYRLHVLAVELPRLSERQDDPVHIARALLRQWNSELGTSKHLSEDACERLTEHNWPGNVRELKNIMRRAYLLADEEIQATDLQFLRVATRTDPYRIEIGMSMQEVERRMILGTLDHFDGDKTRVAEALNLSLKTIYNRLHSYVESNDELVPDNTIRPHRRRKNG